jgi:trimeric autotransporter adhesin
LRVRVGLLAIGIGLLSGCGSGALGNLRFVQASPNAPVVTVYNNRTLEGANLAYPNATGYFSARSGDHFEVLPATGSSPILRTPVTMTLNAYETLIMTGPVSAVNSILLTDGGVTLTVDESSVRVVNASASMGAADVYIVASGSSITGLAPTVSHLGFNANTGYQSVPIGPYEVLMTAPGTKNAFLDTGAINPTTASSDTETVVMLDGVPSGFMFIVLADQ